MILGERDEAQGSGSASRESTGAGGTGGNGGNGEGPGGDVGSPVILATNSGNGAGYIPVGSPSREGIFSSNNQTNYDIPDDIPTGNDDDVVARQLREAATTESDPELREKLWDEYRTYTGLAN